MIYLDNAATTQIDEDALNLKIELQKKYFANPSASYKLARPLKKILRQAREEIAACINAEPHEIYFTSGGTESNNWAIKTSAENFSVCTNIITSAIEHKSILNACDAMERMANFSVTKLPVNNFGVVNSDDLRKNIQPNTKLISIMLANNEVGTIQPIKKFAEICHEHGKIFHTDAVQAVGHIPIDVKDLGADMLSASAHKFNGGLGTGFLYVRQGLNLMPFHNGGGQEFSKRAGTENVPAIAAMALALRKNCAEMKSYCAQVTECANFLVKRLKENHIDFIINGGENRLPGHLSLSFKNLEGEMILHRLDLKNIFVSTGSACNANQIEVSHVLKALKVPKEYALGTIRVTFGKNNNLDDAKKISDELIKIVGRNFSTA